MARFAANVLQIRRPGRRPVIALSATAFAAFSREQQMELASQAELVELDIPTLEYFGGGSVRCMLAEIFLPRKPNPGQRT
jgi:hypothetical protein